MNYTHCTSAMLGLGLVAALAAQDQPAPRAPINSSAGVVRQDGHTLGLGPRYKAEFDAHGMTFVPALGRTVPHNFPLRLEMVSVRRGGQLVVERGASIEPVVDPARVTYPVTKDVRERFDVRPDGVELTVTFDSPPEGSGELAVRYRIVTELDLDAKATESGGRRFSVGDVGGVTLGAVTGVDADGVKVAGEIRIEDDFAEFVLPKEFADSARYPIVLDPLLATDVSVATGTDSDQDCDVCWDNSINNYLFVFSTEFSATDIDVRGQLTNATGTLVGSVLAINTSGVAMHPRVADVDNTNQFLVVWQDSASFLGPFDIQCRRVTPSSGAMSSIIVVASGAADQLEPDIGNTYSTDNDALVVWSDRSQGIRGRQVDVPSTGNPAPVGSETAISTVTTDEQPVISNNGGGSRRVVAFLRTSGADRIVARAVTSAMAPTGTEFQVSLASSTLAPTRPAIDGDGTRFLVAWDYQESSTSFYRNVWCRLVRWTGSDLTADAAASVLGNGASDANDDEREAAVARIGSSLQGTKYVVAWTEQDSGGLNTSIGVVSVDPLSCLACGTTSYFGSGSGGGRDWGPAIGSYYQVGEEIDNCMIAYTDTYSVPPFSSDVWGYRFEAFGVSDTVTNLGGGCGFGGTASRGNRAVLGAQNLEIRLSGATGFLGVALALDVSPPVMGTIPCGPCNALVGLSVVSPTVASPAAGTATAPLPVPCNTFLLGNSLEAQWYVINLGASPCPLVPGVQVSNRIKITIGE